MGIMIEFLQAYGTWIILAGLFILMLRMHAGGGGCGMDHASHSSTAEKNTDPAVSQKSTDPDHATTHSSGGCH